MDIPKIFISLGIGLIFIGFVLKFGARAPWLFSWFGNLPGDIKLQGERTFFYAPIVSTLLVSVVISLIIAVIQRLGR